MKKRLLWLDDDHLLERFEYEIMVIEEDFGWALKTATCLDDAVELLASENFDAVLLDQQFPVQQISDENMASYAPEAQDVWMGCVLLYWLRGKIMDIPQSPAEVSNMLIELPISPLEVNKAIPVVMLSVANEKAVTNALGQASKGDKGISMQGKPVDLVEIERFLSKI
jgi:CheY-like chemotaxis protein